MPYKMKYWREYYLVKHKRKYFSGINIEDLDKIISYMCLSLQLRVILMWECCTIASSLPMVAQVA